MAKATAKAKKTPAKKKAKRTVKKSPGAGAKKISSSSQLLLGTRKGLLHLVRKGSSWILHRESFTGIQVPYSFFDDRTGTLWASLEHGHWGAKLHRSKDMGRSWEELALPKYPEGAMIKEGKPAKLEMVWYIAPGGLDEPNRIYFGTIPGGLFVSDDNGDSNRFVESLWNHPSREKNWGGGGRNDAGLSSVFVDPRNSKRIFVGASVGGIYVSENHGKTWEGRNKGLRADFLPDPYSEFGHDPHYMTFSLSNPDVLWQQNHCGIFRSADGGRNWQDISQKKGPASFGWSIAVDPADEKVAWVIPASSDMTRVAIKGQVLASRTTNGGKTWQTVNKGLPAEMAYDIFYRHALDYRDGHLAFGSTTGNLFYSSNRGDRWESLGNNLPPIYSVRFV